MVIKYQINRDCRSGKIAYNALPAAALRVLPGVSFLYLLRLQVWWMPAYGTRPHCRLTARYQYTIIFWSSSREPV